MPIVGASLPVFHQYAFAVDFGHGLVRAQRCSPLNSTGVRSEVLIERGLTSDSAFADLTTKPPAYVTVHQLDRATRTRVTYALKSPTVLNYGVGPWNNETSDCTEESIVIEYSGFVRTVLEAASEPNA